MKAIPMLFQTDLVKALLDGRKTVTRRPLKMPEVWELHDRRISKITSSHPKKGKWGALIRKGLDTMFPQSDLVVAPCYIGDLIYVRETFTPDPDGNHGAWDEHELSYYEWTNCDFSPQFLPDALKSSQYCVYKADLSMDIKWTPSIHMPRWASRLTLKVTDVRIERVQEITVDQAMMEGICHHSMNCPKAEFGQLWNSVYNNWDQNPYVWVIEFEVIHKNVDQVISEMKGAA